MLDPIVVTCLLVGAMLPYFFSALTMKAVTISIEEIVILIKIVCYI